jgi:hypothetical protein
MSIYQELKAAGVPLASHESNLYAKATPEARKILQGYEFKNNVTAFINQVEGGIWFDIPFAYEPFWD